MGIAGRGSASSQTLSPSADQKRGRSCRTACGSLLLFQLSAVRADLAGAPGAASASHKACEREPTEFTAAEPASYIRFRARSAHCSLADTALRGVDFRASGEAR